MRYYKLNDITSLITDFKLIESSKEFVIKNAKPIDQADEDSLAWVSPDKPNKQELVNKTKAKVIICDSSINIEDLPPNKSYILVENPKLEFLRVVSKLFVPKIKHQIHPSAIIESNAKIGLNVYIGPFTVIGNSTIGDNSYIGSNCTIYDDVIIGKNVNIQAGVVIGEAGFGYSKNSNGESELFPHIGSVIIEDNVDIGANTCIDKGSLGNTVIKKGAKIDNLVHIAHNVVVGENTYIIANAMIGGSSIIEENCWIAPGTALRDNIKIGKKAIIGLGAVVTKSVPEDETWIGNPAKKFQKDNRSTH